MLGHRSQWDTARRRDTWDLPWISPGAGQPWPCPGTSTALSSTCDAPLTDVDPETESKYARNEIAAVSLIRQPA